MKYLVIYENDSSPFPVIFNKWSLNGDIDTQWQYLEQILDHKLCVYQEHLDSTISYFQLETYGNGKLDILEM